MLIFISTCSVTKLGNVSPRVRSLLSHVIVVVWAHVVVWIISDWMRSILSWVILVIHVWALMVAMLWSIARLMLIHVAFLDMLIIEHLILDIICSMSAKSPLIDTSVIGTESFIAFVSVTVMMFVSTHKIMHVSHVKVEASFVS